MHGLASPHQLGLRSVLLLSGCQWMILWLTSGPLGAAETAPTAGVVTLSLDPAQNSNWTVCGSDGRIQLRVTGTTVAGASIDLTRNVLYRTQPSGVVDVGATGLVSPLADGSVEIIAEYEGLRAATQIHVEDFANQRPVSFANQITPIFTKLGCNGGGCHGKASGQNGFKLSLLGFYPEDDYEYLVHESRGRRLFPAAPERSLLLTKPTGESPHGGGQRMDRDSPDYRLIYRWIEQGMPRGDENDPHVVRIDCEPSARVMDRQAAQQVSVIATYNDGRQEDVTRLALFEPNNPELAQCSDTGLVTTLEYSGEVAVMARYQGQASTFRATIPLGPALATSPEPRNDVDRLVFAKLAALGIPPSERCDDATFLRRVSIDLTGTLPTAEDVERFLADPATDKRDQLIDRLLDSPAYADLFANKWSFLLRNKRRSDLDQVGNYEFHAWIWRAMYDNVPYDQFVRDIVTATGAPEDNPAVVWYREVDEVAEQVEDTAQLFLGVRIQCARCHHHPYERWSQDDYHALSAFFSRVGRKAAPGLPVKGKRDRRIVHNPGLATAENPRTKQSVRPAGLGQSALELAPEVDPRTSLVDWMTAPDNPFFAPSLVNRYWKHFFGRGLIEPEDDLRDTNPPTNPELLAGLSQKFVDSGFDLKALVREICRSNAYQLSSEPNEFNLQDKQNFSRYYPRRLAAETLYDAFHQITGTSASFDGLPEDGRALQLPDSSQGPYFLKVFGQPQGDTACECERSQEANLAQSLHLLNSAEVQSKIGGDQGRVPRLLASGELDHPDRIRELYRWAYAREPDADELAIACEYIAQRPDQVRAAYEDILWALLNTKEFLFNH